MKLLIYLSIFALIIAGGGGWSYERQTVVKGIQQAGAAQKEGRAKRPHNKAEAKGQETQRGCEDEEPFTTGIGNTSVDGRSTAGKAADTNVQGSMASGEEYIPSLAEKKRRIAATSETNGSEELDRHFDSSRDDSRAYGFIGSFTITAYTAGYESTQKQKGEVGYGVTASGTYVKEGRTIAADWAVLPPGSIVQIEGLEGTYIVEDKGGGVDGSHIDLYVDDLDRAIEWGRQQRSVWVIKWGI